MRWKVMVLDFDGVLVESVGIKDKAFRALFEDHPQHIEEIMAYHLAHNATIRFEKFQYITENILREPYTLEKKEKLSRAFSDLVVKEIIACPYVNGAIEFLDYYSARLPLYMVSVNPQDELERILEARGLIKYFKKIYADPWKKPEAVAEILTLEGIQPREAVFIGDTFEDYQSSVKSGVDFVARDSQKSFQGADIRIFQDLIQIKDHFCEEARA